MRLVSDMGRKAAALQLDTGNVGAFNGFVDKLRQTLADWQDERFDFLVNNAGTSHHNSIENTT